MTGKAPGFAQGTVGAGCDDRKFHGGETINTLRKYTDEEKAHDVHYTLQLDAREF